MSRRVINQAIRKPRRTLDDLLGTDVKFPPQTGPGGDLAIVTGVKNVEQSIIDILENLLGEVVFHEDLGAELIREVSRNCNQDNADRLAHFAKQQIMKHEARIEDITITGLAIPATSDSEESVIRLDNTFTTITYHHEQNFTYDFVLEGN